MDDVISRQDAIEVADAVWIVTGDTNVAKVWQQLQDLPSAQTADAVEVVRCKNCDNFQTDWETAFANGRHYCAIMDSIMPPDGFCSYGERKTDG